VFKSVGLVARFDQKPALKLTEELTELLAKKGLNVLIEDSLEGKLSCKQKFVPLSEMKTDFIITIGGDGTILRTAINIPKPDTPLFTINMGVRGFLTEVEPQNAHSAIERTLSGDYKVEKSTKMAITAGKESLPDALNPLQRNLQRRQTHPQMPSRRNYHGHPNWLNWLFTICRWTSA
jgi:NAD+ kinase